MSRIESLDLSVSTPIEDGIDKARFDEGFFERKIAHGENPRRLGQSHFEDVFRVRDFVVEEDKSSMALFMPLSIKAKSPKEAPWGLLYFPKSSDQFQLA